MITVQKKDFLEAIKAVKSSVSRLELQPVLKTINIKSENGGITLTGTDLNNSARTSIEANVTTPINICVNADKLDNIVSRLDDLITIDIKEAQLIIQSGKAIFKMLFINAEEFPQIDFNLSEEKAILSHNDFVNSINKTSFATSAEINYMLNGVCFTFEKDKYEIAATDGNRLSQVIHTNSVGLEGQKIIPKKILVDVAKYGKNEVEFYFNKNRVVFKTGDFLFSSNVLEGTFPKYQQLIPQNQPKKAIINKNDLLNALELVSIMSDEKMPKTIFNFNGNTLELMTKCENETARDELEIDYDGEEFKIGFNYKYLLDGLRVMDTEDVIFEMNDALSPCLIKSSFLYLVMPLNLRG